MTLHGMEYPFGQFVSAVLAVSFSSFLPDLSLLTVGLDRVGKRESLDTAQGPCSNRQNIGVLPTLF